MSVELTQDQDQESIDPNSPQDLPTDDLDTESAAVQPPARVSNVMTIPSSSMKRIKQEERDRGRRDAMLELDREAQAIGFRDYASMKAAAAKRSTVMKPAPVLQSDDLDDDQDEKPAERQQPRKVSNLERQLAAATENTRRLNRARAHEERERRRLQALLEEKEAEAELRIAAIESGVQKRYTTTALEILREHLKGMSPDDLKKFDESRYFREVFRVEHPALFGVRDIPATTGASGADAPGATPPRVGDAKPPKPNDTDARKLTTEEYKSRLRKLGLADPSTTSTLTRS